MRRGYDAHRRQQGRSTVSSLTSLPAPKAQPPGAGTGVNSPAGTKAATSTPQTNGIGSNGFGDRSPPLEKVVAYRGARLPRKPGMSTMVGQWPTGAGSTCSSGDLHLAAGEGDAKKVGEHLRSGGDVDVRDGRQWSLLHHASFHGRLAVVGVLLDAGADKEACTAIQMTPLCLACQNGHQEVAKELLRRGASVAGVDVASSDASTGRGMAESGNGDGSMVAHVGPTALFIAAREGHLSLVELLLERRGKSVSILRGPNDKIAGDEFGKGVDEEARSRIRAILADAREVARKEATMLRDRRQEDDSRDAESQIGGAGHQLPLDIRKSQVCASRLPLYDAATPIPVGDGHRPDPVPFPSEESAAPAPAPLSEMSMSQPEEICGTGMPSSISNHHRTVSARRSFGQGAADETENLLGGDGRNDHHVLGNTAGSRRLGEGPSRIQDSWPGTNPDTGSRGVQNGSGVRSDIAMPKPAQQPSAPRDLGSVLNGVTESCMDTRGPHSRVANGHTTASGIATTPSSAPVFKLAVKQPSSAKVAQGTASRNAPGRTPSRVGGDEGDMGVNGGAAASRPSLTLSSPGLPTPQEWQRCVRPNGLRAPPSAPPPACHEDKEQTPPRQMQDLSSNPGGGSRTGAGASMSTSTASRGIGAEPAILSPVEEVMDGDVLADPIQDVTSGRSRSACGEGSKVEFGGASPCEQWLKPLVPPRSATAPPPTSRSPAHVPLSPAGTVGGSVVVGKGDSSEFEDTWRMTFSNLMDLRTLYRMSSRSANGRSAVWMGWEEEKRALEETISELNMRLASKDHDIAELHMQLEERERDLRLMHGRDLDRLGISDLSELEQRVQAALALVQGKRERVVYKLLKEGGDGAGRDSQRPDTVARS